MSEITLEGIAQVIRVELKEQLDPIKTELSSLRQTVDSHTGALDGIAKDVKDLKEEMKTANYRVGKNAEAIKFTATKIGVSPEIGQILQA